jgi:uncharacterized DUF497 family protein
MPMKNLNFIWDENKALSNQQKHGVSFEEAKTVFYDDYARLISDPEHSQEEERFLLLGLSHQFRLLLVCHCYRESGGQLRIISARKANKQEQKQYEGFQNER